MSKQLIRVGTLILITGILAYLLARRLGLMQAPSEAETAAPAAERASQDIPVDALLVNPELLTEELSVTGTLLPDEEVMLTSEVAGVVEAIHFGEGRRVKAGELLLNLNDDELQAQLKKLELQLALAQQQEARRKKLLEIGGISEEEYDESLTEYNSLQAEAELIKVQIAKRAIRAPFSGVIGLREVSEGSYLTPGTRIARLVKTNPIKVSFAIPEKYGNRIEPGSSISFQVEGMDQAFDGRIYAQEPYIDMETRTLTYQARSNNPQNRLIPGAFADITIVLNRFEQALMVPTEALVPEQSGQKLYLYREGKPEPIAVKTGIRNADRVQIVDGLSPGDTVITSGLLQIRPGVGVSLSHLN